MAGSFVTIENQIDQYYLADCITYPDNEVTAVFGTTQSHQTSTEAYQIVSPCSVSLSHSIQTAVSSAIPAATEPVNTPESIIRHRLREPLLWLFDSGISLKVDQTKQLECQLRDIIASDLERRWRINDVATQIGCSEATLRRRLADCHTSYSEIMMTVRLEHGLAMLQSSEQSITTIAYQCGFASPSHFSQCFKHRFNIAPSQIRSA